MSAEQCTDGRDHTHYADVREGHVIDHCRRCGHINADLGPVPTITLEASPYIDRDAL